MTKTQWAGYLSGEFVHDTEDPCNWGSPSEFPSFFPQAEFPSSWPSLMSGDASVGLPSLEATCGDGFAPPSLLEEAAHVARRTIYRRPSKIHESWADVLDLNGCSITHRRILPCLRSCCRCHFGPKSTHGPS
ncbi:uncharacterized protein LOC131001069 [Salvia miltiorrhiza]|uniref:uncharacterized protein LOC131001069 n=1 Tax=Salvia miltiorrhiza TaxID=226208 RepID=UPI0025AD21D2|nr:uncharacterized protein LOC131001069 [Salvia miltiorrhiza]